MTVLQETLPWRITYQGFSGRLPNITAIRLLLVGIAFKTVTNGLTCLAGTTARNPAVAEEIIGSGGRVEGLRVEERTTIPLGGGFLCEIAGGSHFSGTGTILDLPGLHAITVTLI